MLKIKNLFLIFFLIFCSIVLKAQQHIYFARAIDNQYDLKIERENDYFIYLGKDENLKKMFDEFNILEFKKIFPNSKRINNKKTYLIISDNSGLVDFFNRNLSNIFEFIEYVGIQDADLLYFPDDYGITGGANLGIPANLNYLDFIKVPEAWDYTKGNEDIKIGISDGGPIDLNDIDFFNRVLVLGSENYSTNEGVFSHGINVSAIAAAKGDNSYASTGVCYDCKIIKSGYGSVVNIIDLYEAGAKVINCSWSTSAYSTSFQNIIDEIAENGTIIVASSGNLRGALPNQYQYPASYNNVISVGAVGSGNDLSCSNIVGQSIYNVKNYISGEVLFSTTPNCTLPLEEQVHLNISTTATLNDKVDILAPGSGHFRHYQSVITNTAVQASSDNLWTSPSAPIVSGTVGLMFSLNDCLAFNEVDAVLKLSSDFIGDILANQIADGYYGSGTLNTFEAVKFTYESMIPNGNAVIDNQDFWRFNFDLSRISNNLTISNLTLRETNTSTFKAKNSIDVIENSDFNPTTGFIDLSIDSEIDICSSAQRISKNKHRKEENDYDLIKRNFDKKVHLYPNPNEGDFRLVFNGKIPEEIEVTIFDVYGKLVHSLSSKESEIDFKLNNLNSGVYFVKVSSSEINESIKFIKK